MTPISRLKQALRPAACRRHAIVLSMLCALVLVGRAEAPHVYAIAGARIVTVSGAPIDSGTILLRNGFIEAVGNNVTPPADAVVIDGKGLTVYPGLIDLGNTSILPAAPEAPRGGRTLMEIERARREVLLRPQFEAAGQLRPDAPELERLATAGITAVLLVPPGELVAGRSSLVATAASEDAPQIGNVADARRGLYVVRTPVALHVSFPERDGGGTYPASLMGAIAFVRQAFLDASHYQAEMARYERVKKAMVRPAYDPALEALQPAVAGRLPVAFEAGTAVEIRRVLALGREFRFGTLICGGVEADQVAADLKAQNAAVIYSLNYPTRPRSLSADADEPMAILRRRAGAPKVPAALQAAGVRFAFQSAGLRDPKDFVKNAAKAVKAGLSPEAALRALTLDAAGIAGVGDRLGSIEKGKLASLVVTDGDLFAEKTRVKHVFVEGRPVPLDATDAAMPSRR